ncbi:hypothetical protein CI109_106685 [Kwoniella shandongensis]|uniref:Aminotransferase class I/classII large domain-containing protein n=1 Tax=Kwoniella shandongensis TaxID=1734106 RepID=A0A5M6BR47_9TREE|nr:uncharacterized protein CI109_006423 [Kwoniella shandongensis]KAA5525253.1 hypothetical protein CI109_006423 [Kwoniella shandongensis]
MSPAPTLPESLDLSHHVNKRIRTVQPSAMKAMGALLQNKNLLSLGGGTPHPSLFPMSHTTFTLPTLQSLDGDVDDWKEGTAPTEEIHLKKTGPGTELDEGGVLDLSVILQYGLSNGYRELVDKLEEINLLLHGKTISDASVYVTLGNTDGVSKVFQLLVEPDVDTVLTEGYSFSSSLNSARAKGAKVYPVRIDEHGLDPVDFEHVLSSWDETTQGRKPHILYTIPCGQNPTGTIQPQERYDAIYAVAQKHDVIIVEDDPYFPLQFTSYEPDITKRAEQLKEARAKMPPPPSKAEQDDPAAIAKVFNEYAAVKSYLSRDVDGRVIRIDTFSKVFGPGVRLGWVSANSLFVERLLRIGETSTQIPNGFSQAVLASYLSDKHWGIGGFIRWMWGVRLEYQAKRDFFLDKFREFVPSDLVSTTPCGAGMFQWLKVEVTKHPRFRRTPLPIGGGPVDLGSDTVENDTTVTPPGLETKTESTEYTTNTSELVDELWSFLLEQHTVLVLPAKAFLVSKPGVDRSADLNFFRATFAGDHEGIDKALAAFGKGIKAWFARG